jgi:uncharacterized membrane protein
MMESYDLAKFLHVLGAAILFGTGLGIAFFMYMADRAGDVRAVAVTVRHVVLADFLFTATAVILQPVTGVWLALTVGYPLTEGWIVASLVLYVVTGLCWLPVVWIQVQIGKMAQEAADNGAPLPQRYRRLMRIWFWLGWPAFLSVIAIFWLMIDRPDF